jgi:hypothetical protein
MEWLQRIMFGTLKWVLMGLFVDGLIVTILDEGLRILRARNNTKGTIVYGFALYEKDLPLPRVMEKIIRNWPFPNKVPGWEFVEFYQYNIECEFWRSRKQSKWETERQMKLKTQPKEKPIWQDDELPVLRYECGPSRMLYRGGQGWGLF